jgi:uncharacterized protein YegL
MTDQDYTHLAIVADRSGSMHGIASDMNGAIRSLLEDQAKEPGTLKVDITTFDDQIEFPFTDADPLSIKGDVILPRSMTALNDAIGVTINRLGKKFSLMDEEKRPSKVVVVVVTDGLENASREFTYDQVKKMVEEQTTQWGWTFIYLAANVDAFATGVTYGFARGSTIAYSATAGGTESVVGSASRGVSQSRAGKTVEFTDEEREAATKE